jgi:hypothetical protein
LFVSDDGSRSVWHITYAGHGARAAAGKGGSPGV